MPVGGAAHPYRDDRPVGWRSAVWSTGAGTGRSVVFFDGVCVLCNGATDWLLAEDGDDG